MTMLSLLYILYFSMNQLPLLRRKQKPKRLNNHQIHNLIRQQQFDTRHSITQQPKRYQSLIDPHTTYFFASPPARQQLKHLKRIATQEPNARERNQMRRNIHFRIKTNKIHDRNIRTMHEPTKDFTFEMTKIASCSVSSMYTLYKKFSDNEFSTRTNYNKNNKHQFEVTTESQALKVRKDTQSFQEQALERSIINPEKLASRQKKLHETETNQRANKLRQHLHKTKHLKWMSFLNDRKQQYMSRANQPLPS